MSPLRASSSLFCAAGLWIVCGAAAAQVPPWNEGPGDIVITREVPRQNAVLVGEPGRPTLVNPKTAVMGANVLSAASGFLAPPLSDLEAETVRATRAPEAETLGDHANALLSDDAGAAAFAVSPTLSQDRSGFMGQTVTGAFGEAGRQIQGVLAGALGGGRP